MEDTEQMHKYRLVFTDDRGGLSHEVELEEKSAAPAFDLARTDCGDGEVEIFEDDRPLGRVKQASTGFWVVS